MLLHNGSGYGWCVCFRSRPLALQHVSSQLAGAGSRKKTSSMFKRVSAIIHTCWQNLTCHNRYKFKHVAARIAISTFLSVPHSHMALRTHRCALTIPHSSLQQLQMSARYIYNIYIYIYIYVYVYLAASVLFTCPGRGTMAL